MNLAAWHSPNLIFMMAKSPLNTGKLRQTNEEIQQGLVRRQRQADGANAQICRGIYRPAWASEILAWMR